MIFFWAEPKRNRYVIGNHHVVASVFRDRLKHALHLATTYRRIVGNGKLGYKINTLYDNTVPPYPPESGWMVSTGMASMYPETINLTGAMPSVGLQQFLRNN